MNALPKQTELVKFNDGKFEGRWLARVKNTENGHKWIEKLRKKNPGLKFTLYGRSPDRKSRCLEVGSRYYPNYHRPKIAETIVIYVDRKYLPY